MGSGLVSVPLRGKGRNQPQLGSSIEPSSAVSVPLRGKGRDQPAGVGYISVTLYVEFPSPCGEKVGINEYLNSMAIGPDVKFPSPCGEKVGINGYSTSRLLESLLLFPSPCGEKVGINAGLQRDPQGLPSRVSVPLRGKGRDQHRYDWHNDDNWRIPFPSPCGEKVGINLVYRS